MIETQIPDLEVLTSDGRRWPINIEYPISNVGAIYRQTFGSVLINNVRLDDDPTSYTSGQLGIRGWSATWVMVKLSSTLAPTNIRILAQFGYDQGGGNVIDWYDFEEGLWGALYWEDTDVASGINKIFLLPCGGVDYIRFVATATGSDAANYFDVTVRCRQFRGNFGVAHA